MEFVGTFFLVLVVAFTTNPLAIGGVLAALIYMGGYISGAHYNPAVTIAALINNRISLDEAIQYIVTQFLAGIFAAGAFAFIHGSLFLPKLGHNVSPLSASIIEILFTFLLCSVILHVTSERRVKDNSYYGLAIGFTLMAAAFVGGPISGGVFNPAVGVSPLLLDIVHFPENAVHLAIYLLGPLAGGALAGVVFKKLFA